MSRHRQPGVHLGGQLSRSGTGARPAPALCMLTAAQPARAEVTGVPAPAPWQADRQHGRCSLCCRVHIWTTGLPVRAGWVHAPAHPPEPVGMSSVVADPASEAGYEVVAVSPLSLRSRVADSESARPSEVKPAKLASGSGPVPSAAQAGTDSRAAGAELREA